MHAPLDQFADRIICNDEVEIFIRGLIEKGVRPVTLLKAVVGKKPNAMFASREAYIDYAFNGDPVLCQALKNCYANDSNSD
jgi:hypothetical protein